MGAMSQVPGVFGTLVSVAMVAPVFQHTALFELSATSLWVWIGALVAYDFCCCGLHRAGHRVAALRAAHVTLPETCVCAELLRGALDKRWFGDKRQHESA